MDLQVFPFIAMTLPAGVRAHGARLVVSCCLNINKYFAGLSTTKNYDEFYRRLQNIRTALNGAQSHILIGGGNTLVSMSPLVTFDGPDLPLRYFPGEQLENLHQSDYDRLSDQLWSLIFPVKRVDNESTVPNPQVGSNIVQMTEGLTYLNNFLVQKSPPDRPPIPRAAGSDATPPIDQLLRSIKDFARSTEKRAAVEWFLFANRHGLSKQTTQELAALVQTANQASGKVEGPEPFASLAQRLAEHRDDILTNYLSADHETIDIDEVIHNFSTLSNEPAIMRLMGLARDFEIQLPPSFVPGPGAPTDFFLAIIPGQVPQTDILSIPTRMRGIFKDGKFAYLLGEDQSPNKPHFFDNSILRVRTNNPAAPTNPWISHLYTSDKIAHEIKLAANADLLVNNSGAMGEDPEEAFTRGIIFGNTGLAEMVRPVEYPFTSGAVLPDTFVFTEEFLTHGHRVGVVINDNYYSLTGRRLELTRLQPKDDDPFFVSDRNEGPIHFDAVANYVQNGKLNSAISDALFEYAGELLGLKGERFVRNSEFHHDAGLSKSQLRVQRAIDFLRFPEEKKNDQASLRRYFDLPQHFTPGHSPQLRFNKPAKQKKYTFVVYSEYLNGWGLPLVPLKEFPLQLSVQELTAGNSLFLPNEITFDPLENKKPLLLFLRKDPQKDGNPVEASEKTVSKPLDNEALETLIVWSKDSDGHAHSCSRHVLPARIAFEHAFWHDLLSGMDGDQSFEWKRKYNCPFADQDQYNDFTGGLGKPKCPENECSAYCGGTAMKTFYEEDHIIPSHLSDPTITGFEASFFREDSYVNAILEHPVTVKFGGTPGLEPQSFLLDVDGSKFDLEVRVVDSEKRLAIRLKPGMRIWALLRNQPSDDCREGQFQRAWYQDLAPIHARALSRMCSPNPEKKNPPRPIKIVHAVKQPVMTPEIKTLSSLPDEDYKYSHVREWLVGEYAGLTLAGNVIAKRRRPHNTDQDERDSSLVSVDLTAAFERLDAFWRDGKVTFVDHELPTGGLELWMRKEEYTDNPDQIPITTDVLPGAVGAHLPDEPVVPFEDNRHNVSHREYSVEFTDEIMNQLKVRPVVVGNPSGDIFRELTSSLTLGFDAKSTKFEERRYTLRNISSFKALFTDEADNLDDDYAARSDEFRVLTLNNSQPAKPFVSHAVTTIQETRERSDHATIAKQKGNIVTVYLKRNRLSSGRNERVGVIVYNENSRYFQAFMEGDNVSKAGRDIVSDSPTTRTASPFIRYDDNDITKRDIVVSPKNFDGRFHEDLGIVSYLPEFDAERRLWKFEIELDIKTPDGFQLHNPFVVFSFVHFQPFSLNYNTKWARWPAEKSTVSDMAQDFRLSTPESFIWCYLLPERKMSVSLDKPGIWGLGSWTDFLDRWGNVVLTISFDNESLHYFQGQSRVMLRSNFIASVEGSNDRIAWFPVMSQIDGAGSAEWRLTHPLLRKGDLRSGPNEVKKQLKYKRNSNPTGSSQPPAQNFSDFRVRLIEVEWFTESEWEQLSLKPYEDIVEDEGMRVRYVELIY